MSPTATACPDDLRALSRRRPLSGVERQALAAHLGHCAACRAADALADMLAGARGTDKANPGLEADAEVDPTHAALIDRLAVKLAASAGADRRAGAVTAGQAHRNGRPRGRRRAVARAAAAAVAMLCAAAAAALATRLAAPAHREPSAVPLSHESQPLQRRTPPASAVREPPSTTAAVAGPEPSEVTAKTASSGERARSRGLEAAAPGAADLFAQANATRRRGDLVGAITGYRALERVHPKSDEALVAAISLGELLLARHQPAAALAELDSYLSRQPQGALAEEALYGRARCLRMLGRTAEEREAWRVLERRFPRSLYRAAEPGDPSAHPPLQDDGSGGD